MIIQSLLALGHYSITLPYLSCDGNWILPITHCTLVCAIHDAYIRGSSGKRKQFFLSQNMKPNRERGRKYSSQEVCVLEAKNPALERDEGKKRGQIGSSKCSVR